MFSAQHNFWLRMGCKLQKTRNFSKTSGLYFSMQNVVFTFLFGLFIWFWFLFWVSFIVFCLKEAQKAIFLQFWRFFLLCSPKNSPFFKVLVFFLFVFFFLFLIFFFYHPFENSIFACFLFSSSAPLRKQSCFLFAIYFCLVSLFHVLFASYI